MNISLKQNITLQNALHVFRQGRGMGTATMEAKLAQKLAGIVQKPFPLVFIDVRKAYNSKDRERCTEIIRGYDLVTNIQRLLQWYWYRQKVVPKSGKCFGRSFRTETGVTQGDPVSPIMFNIAVNEVVREVPLEVCGPLVAHHGLGGLAGKHNICFYADDRWIEW